MTATPTSIQERFWSKVLKDPDDPERGCWLWIGSYMGGGYGQFSIDGKHIYAHRWSYQSVKGAIPDGLVLDHLCRVRHCVNPAHLEAVTNRENLRRGEGFVGKQARQTQCKRGHDFTPENTRITRRGERHCRTCSREAERARRACLPKLPKVKPVPTHCTHGHEFTPSNTYTDKLGCRRCRKCRSAAVQRCKQRRIESHSARDYLPESES